MHHLDLSQTRPQYEVQLTPQRARAVEVQLTPQRARALKKALKKAHRQKHRSKLPQQEKLSVSASSGQVGATPMSLSLSGWQNDHQSYNKQEPMQTIIAEHPEVVMQECIRTVRSVPRISLVQVNVLQTSSDRSNHLPQINGDSGFKDTNSVRKRKRSVPQHNTTQGSEVSGEQSDTEKKKPGRDFLKKEQHKLKEQVRRKKTKELFQDLEETLEEKLDPAERNHVKGKKWSKQSVNDAANLHIINIGERMRGIAGQVGSLYSTLRHFGIVCSCGTCDLKEALLKASSMIATPPLAPFTEEELEPYKPKDDPQEGKIVKKSQDGNLVMKIRLIK